MSIWQKKYPVPNLCIAHTYMHIMLDFCTFSCLWQRQPKLNPEKLQMISITWHTHTRSCWVAHLVVHVSNHVIYLLLIFLTRSLKKMFRVGWLSSNKAEALIVVVLWRVHVFVRKKTVPPSNFKLMTTITHRWKQQPSNRYRKGASGQVAEKGVRGKSKGERQNNRQRKAKSRAVGGGWDEMTNHTIDTGLQ